MSLDLPRGWYRAKVREVGAVQLGRQRSPDVHTGSNMRPYLRVANVYEDRIDLTDVMQMHFEPREIDRYELKFGDILLNEGQSRELVGRPAMYRGELPGACFTNSLVRFQANEVVLPEFALAQFLHWLKSGAFIPQAQITTNIAHLGAGRFAEMEFALPPLNEQRRIVAKLESLQARSRRAREALDAVPPLLEKLRQSILAAAFRGDLTKDWRAKHPSPEPATELLKRIRTERRKRWEEAEFAKLQTKSRAPADARRVATYEESRVVDINGAESLPEGWAWASLEEIADSSRGIPYGIVLTGKPTAGGVPTVRCGDIKEFRIETADLKCVAVDIAAQYERTELRGGEVLIAIRGTVGATAVAGHDMAGMNISREVAMIPVLPGVEPAYLAFCLASPSIQARLMKHTKGVAQTGINLSDLRTLAVPIAPVGEQIALLHAINAGTRRYARIKEALRRSNEIATAVDQSILAKAFRGELVPQDPSDEPAEALLARLRGNETSPTLAKSKPRGRRSKAAE